MLGRPLDARNEAESVVAEEQRGLVAWPPRLEQTDEQHWGTSPRAVSVSHRIASHRSSSIHYPSASFLVSVVLCLRRLDLRLAAIDRPPGSDSTRPSAPFTAHCPAHCPIAPGDRPPPPGSLASLDCWLLHPDASELAVVVSPPLPTRGA